MNVKILIIEEIIKRLKSGIEKNDDLKDIKNIQIGSFSEIRTASDLPSINLFVKNVKESNSSFRGRSVNEINFLIRIVCNKLKENYNTLYFIDRYGKCTGPLFLLDCILNLIDKDVINNLDLSFDNKVLQNNGYSYEIIEENDIVIFDISFFVVSKEFSYGDR